MKDFFSGRKSHCTWCRYAYCRQKSSKKPIYQGTKCSLAARNPLLHQLQKFLCIFAEELAHYKSILNPAEMKDRIEKNIDSFIMPVCPVLLRTYPESNMWYGPCDLWGYDRFKGVHLWVMGLSKDSENLSYVREIEKIWLIGPRTENNKKGHNTSL